MKATWIQKWCDGFLREWTCDELGLYITKPTIGDEPYTAFGNGEPATYLATMPIEDVIAAEEIRELARLKGLVLRLEYGPFLPLVLENAPVEIIEGSQDRLGYGEGWLRVRQGREVPADWKDEILLDGGVTAHVHPFILASPLHARTFPSVYIGDRIAGIRWLDKAK